MPRWLKGMVAPTLVLWLYAIASGIAYSAAPDGEISKRAHLVSRVAFPLIIAQWLKADTRKRGRALYYDYDSFVFFAFPVIAPVYLFQTRGVRALITLLCFCGIWLVTMVPAVLASVFRHG